MKSLQSQLKAGGSTLALVTASFFSSAADAQNSPADNSVEQVTITGTSIKGLAPVGSNLITVDQQAITDVGAVTVTEVLANVPAITGMGNSGRGSNGNGGAGASVYIHQIGASAQNSTLVIMDGHRLPVAGSGNGNPVVDPNIIPQNMLERVEVLADGASSVYGSDAVSGVVNFITRKKFDGLELRYQAQFEHGSSLGQLGSILAGQSWDKGGFIAAYSYSAEGHIHDTSIPQTNPLIQPQRAIDAGLTGTTGSSTHQGNFFCDPATVQPNGSGNIFLSPQGTTSVANSVANAPCSQWQYGDYLPSETRQNAMIKVTQELTNSVTLKADALWETRRAVYDTSRGTLQATAFGSGAQANPFYTNPPGITATKQTIRYDFDQLLGPGAWSGYGDDELVGDATLTWNVNDNWTVDLLASAGRSDSFVTQNHGVVNQGMVTLDLNGTNQTSGTLPAGTASSTSIPGLQTTINQLPLTATNALDVWNPAATNRTAAATLAALVAPQANNNLNHGVNSYEQFRAVVNGTLFNWDGGPVKVAAGVEQFNSQLYNYVLNPQNAGPSAVSSNFLQFNFGRLVTSEFGEVDVPLIGPGMNIPFVTKFEVDASVRHDAYSDVGTTTNPKVSFNLDTIDGLRFRGSWSTSFVAVALEHDVSNGQVANASVTSGTPGVLPVALFPVITQLGIPGCTAASLTCDTSSLQGLNSSGNTQNLRPERGHGWTLGFDYAPSFLPGLNTSLTYWHVTYLGGATAATTQIDAFNPLLNNRITVLAPAVAGTPSCATPAQIAAFIGTAPVNTIIPGCVSTLTDTATDNLINFWASGIDLSVGYHFDSDFGAFVLEDSLSQQTQFLQGFGHTPPPSAYRFEVINSVGLNTTFPNVGTQMRGHLGWALDDFAADIYVNYVGPYTNVSANATTLIGSTNGIYNGTGGDPVDAFTTVDLHLGYTFDTGFLGSDNVSLTIRNLLNTYPPFFNGTQGSNNGTSGTTSTFGFDAYTSNPIGRIIELGFTAKL
ncbi:MAG TPA: TonB-dependent receptor [Rhizomicrobium sp.]|nr:TonB-dependent receptor [Rhizomicrobium sp.]